jgi:hypothetical protein
LTEKEIIRFDYITALDPSCHYEFLTDEKFDRRASMYFNKTQTHFVVTNDDQVLFVDISDNDNPKQYDIGAKELVEDIQSVAADDNHFYIFANRKDDNIGFYLFSIDTRDPNAESIYIIN